MSATMSRHHITEGGDCRSCDSRCKTVEIYLFENGNEDKVVKKHAHPEGIHYEECIRNKYWTNAENSREHPTDIFWPAGEHTHEEYLTRLNGENGFQLTNIKQHPYLDLPLYDHSCGSVTNKQSYFDYHASARGNGQSFGLTTATTNHMQRRVSACIPRPYCDMEPGFLSPFPGPHDDDQLPDLPISEKDNKPKVPDVKVNSEPEDQKEAVKAPDEPKVTVKVDPDAAQDEAKVTIKTEDDTDSHDDFSAWSDGQDACPLSDSAASSNPGSPVKLAKSKTTIETLRQYFHLPINEAARQLDICPTVLKKICRRHGMSRWPHRKIKSIEKLIANLKGPATTVNDPRIEKEIETLENEKKRICMEVADGGPDTPRASEATP